MRFEGRLSAVLVLALALPAAAQEPESRWKFGGFGTLGLAWNSTGQADFLRDVAQPAGATRHPDGRVDTRLGLQADAKLAQTLQATLQVVSKYRYDATYTPDITWAFLGWTPQPEFKVRLGRLGVESFMNADSRDVGYSYLLVRPPMEVFGVVPVTRLDGLDATGTFATGPDTTLRLKAFYGGASERLPLPAGGTAATMDLTGDRVQGLIAELQTGVWRARLSYAGLDIRTGFPAEVQNLQAGLEAFARRSGNPQLIQTADTLNFTGGSLASYTAGLACEDGPFQGQALLAKFRSDRTALPKGWAGYVSLGYRVGEVVPYGFYSREASEPMPALYLGGLPPSMAALVQGFVQEFGSSQSTEAVGVRWDCLAKADLKLQVERVATTLPTRLWAQVQPGWDGRATVVSAVLDFVF